MLPPKGIARFSLGTSYNIPGFTFGDEFKIVALNINKAFIPELVNKFRGWGFLLLIIEYKGKKTLVPETWFDYVNEL